MLDDSSNDRILTERTSREIGSLDNEEFGMNKVEDCCDEYNDQYCLEMFRYALKDDDQQARKRLEQKFGAILLDWLHDHPKSVLACQLHTKEYYVFETFRSFWHTLRIQKKFDLASMADVLFHLHVSMNGVILDTLRNYSRPQEATLTSTILAGETHANGINNSHEIWGLVGGKLSNARERRMAYLLFHCALKPVEIVASFPNEFCDVNEISYIRRTIMEII